jgi:prepilin peptidase CpaA
MESGTGLLAGLKTAPPEMWAAAVLSLLFAATDLRTRRIPNVLTMGGALVGLGYNVWTQGSWGLAQGGLGLLLGLGLLMIPYVMGGTGAGDVKALAALGAWLGPMRIISVFFYMALAGGLISLAVMGWRGDLRIYLRRLRVRLVNMVLTRSPQEMPPAPASSKSAGIPYAVPIALGVLAVLIWGEIW